MYLLCLFLVCFYLEALVKGLAPATQVVPATQTPCTHRRCRNLAVFVGCVGSASGCSVVSLFFSWRLAIVLEVSVFTALDEVCKHLSPVRVHIKFCE